MKTLVLHKLWAAMLYGSIALWSTGPCERQVSENQTAVTAAPTSVPTPTGPEMNPRPRLWFMGIPAPIKDRPEDAALYEKLFVDAEKTVLISPDIGTPMKDEAALGTIAEAQRLILGETPPAAMWQWGEVRQAVADFGRRIPIRDGGEDPSGLKVSEYDSIHNVLLVFPAQLRRRDAEFAASMLVHEATHVVVYARMREMSSFTLKDLFDLHISCTDFGVLAVSATEYLAFRNQARWSFDRPAGRAALDVHPSQGVLRLALAAESGRDPEYSAYAGFIRSYAMRNGAFAQVHNLCGPVVMIRGPRRGQFFFPSDLEPRLLVPFFNVALLP